MKKIIAFTFLVVLSLCYGKHPVVVEHDALEDDYIKKQAQEILLQLLEVKSGENFVERNTGLGFSWSNCGKKTDTIQVKSLTEGPDPIVIPGNVTISADVIIGKDFTPTSLELKVYKKLFGVYIEVPCVDNFGSCTYKDPCSLLKKVKCPPSLKKYGITCTCPIMKNNYDIKSTTLAVPAIKLPSFIENGDYKIQGTLMNGSERLGCYEVQATLKTK